MMEANGTAPVVGEVRRILQELGVEDPDAEGQLAKVTLSRRDGRGSNYAWLETFEDPEEFTLEAVRERYGGGEYQARLMDPAGQFIKTRTFKIAGPSKRPPEEEPAPRATPELEAVRVQLEELRAELARAREPKGSDALLDMFKIVVPMMTAMQQASATAMAPLLEALAKRDKPALDPLEMLERAADLLERRNGGGGSGGYEGVIREVGLPLLGKLHELAHQERAPGELANPESAPVLHRRPVPPPPVSGSPMLPPWAQLIAPHLEGLLTLATVRADPAFAVEKVLENASEEELSFIGDQLDKGDDGRAEFFALFPPAMRYRSWFDSFFDALDDALPQEGEEGPDGPDAPR